MKIFSVPLVVVFCLTANIYSQVLLEDNFDYTAGNLLTDHGWVAHSDAGIDPIMVVSPGLSFAGHPGSGIGNAAHINQFGGSGEDDHKLFTSVTSGAVYTSFMVKQDDNDADGYFFHYSSNPHTPGEERATVWLRTTIGTGAQFGLSFGTGLAIFPGLDFTIGETYFFVLKYEIVSGNDNDEVSLYIFDESAPPTNTEPGTPYIGPRQANGTTEINPGSINLRQHLATKSITIDGILVSTTWSDVVTNVINSGIFNPVEFNLSQNYPNPFNPSTTINFSLPVTGYVQLIVYDVLGNEVAILINEEKSAGRYKVNWDAKNNPSGVYTYRIEAGEYTEVKKMVLLK